jgi:AsnC-type helix-turn-helix domain
MDVFDQKLLKLIQKSCRITTEELGHQIGLSATSCQLFFDNGNIEKFQSTVVMENVKVGLEIPLNC